MGTNYYQRTDICECCKRFKQRHIGKNSMGWQFSFQGYSGFEDNPKIKSFEDWKRELQADGKIFDEYGRELTFEEFVELVEKSQTEKLNHYDWCHKQGYDMGNDWKDPEEYAFGFRDFS